MKVGQIYLEKASNEGAQLFQAVIEGLDRLAVEQHVLVACPNLARSLDGLPYVTVGPVVSTPVMAYCLVPPVDVAHVHDSKSGQVGLLLRLTRSTPYVLNAAISTRHPRNPLLASIQQRAQLSVDTAVVQPHDLVATYRSAIMALSKRPEHADRRE